MNWKRSAAGGGGGGRGAIMTLSRDGGHRPREGEARPQGEAAEVRPQGGPVADRLRGGVQGPRHHGDLPGQGQGRHQGGASRKDLAHGLDRKRDGEGCPEGRARGRDPGPPERGPPRDAPGHVAAGRRRQERDRDRRRRGQNGRGQSPKFRYPVRDRGAPWIAQRKQIRPAAAE